MDTFYGFLLIVYALVFGAWWISLRDTAVIERRYSHDLQNSKVRVVLSLRQKLTWAAVLATLLVGWLASWSPAFLGSLFLAGVSLIWGTVTLHRRFQPLRKPHFRYWAVATLVWVATVSGWVLVFGRVTRLHTNEIVLLAIIPPAIAALAFVGWRWAKNPK